VTKVIHAQSCSLFRGSGRSLYIIDASRRGVDAFLILQGGMDSA